MISVHRIPTPVPSHTFVFVLAVVAGCGGGGDLISTGDADATTSDSAALGDAAVPAEAFDDGRAHERMLTLTLDPALDQPGDDVKASSLLSADLLDVRGASLRSGAITDGRVRFNLSGIEPGDYFIRVGGDEDDLIPTRIGPAPDDVAQRVGQMLRASVIGPTKNPTYRIKTYSAGQKKGVAVRFSDGTPIPGEQAYVILTLADPSIEIRVLGTGAALASVTPDATHSYAGARFDSWMLNTPDSDHHGDLFKSDGGAATCGSCHWDYWMKKPSYMDLKPTRGWCFRCHNGIEGDESGFVDPAR